jgi:hypothetical protein
MVTEEDLLRKMKEISIDGILSRNEIEHAAKKLRLTTELLRKFMAKMEAENIISIIEIFYCSRCKEQYEILKSWLDTERFTECCSNPVKYSTFNLFQKIRLN